MQYTFLDRISDAFETSVVKPKPITQTENQNKATIKKSITGYFSIINWIDNVNWPP